MSRSRYASLIVVAGLALAGPGGSSAQDVPQAFASQDGGSETSLTYIGGCDPGGPCGQSPANVGGPDLVVRTPGTLLVRLDADAQSVGAELSDSSLDDTPLTVSEVDPAHWQISVPAAVPDGKYLRVQSTTTAGGARNWVATFRAPPPPATPVPSPACAAATRALATHVRALAHLRQALHRSHVPRTRRRLRSKVAGERARVIRDTGTRQNRCQAGAGA